MTEEIRNLIKEMIDQLEMNQLEGWFRTSQDLIEKAYKMLDEDESLIERTASIVQETLEVEMNIKTIVNALPDLKK